MSSAFITGVSSGIGYSIARAYMSRGWKVYGVSRRRPTDLADDQRLEHACLDLADHHQTKSVLAELLAGVRSLDVAVLNAGVLGQFEDLGNVELDDLKQVMEVNVWSNKTVVDTLFCGDRRVGQVVAISSGASINGNRGWSGYSISKAALNMLTKLYSRERPKTHFSALAPGIVYTAMLDRLCSLPQDERFPALEQIRDKRGTHELPSPEQVADRLIDTFARLPQLVTSGDFADIRSLPSGGC
jgi:NAD(P)-dependent dehydrogenase (short-subunit alcohol dehydrogenase family)